MGIFKLVTEIRVTAAPMQESCTHFKVRTSLLCGMPCGGGGGVTYAHI